jgi:hypothetical protein
MGWHGMAWHCMGRLGKGNIFVLTLWIDLHGACVDGVYRQNHIPCLDIWISQLYCGSLEKFTISPAELDFQMSVNLPLSDVVGCFIGPCLHNDHVSPSQT